MDSEFISLSEEYSEEFHIRKISNGHFWNGTIDRPLRFTDVEIAKSNHFITEKNALIGVVAILFRKDINRIRHNDPIGEVPWEIVAYNPITRSVRNIVIEADWFQNIGAIVSLSHKLQPFNKADVRSFANALIPNIGKLVSIGLFNGFDGDFEKNIKYLKEHFPQAVYRNEVCGFVNTVDSALAKVYFGSDIIMIKIEKGELALS